MEGQQVGHNDPVLLAWFVAGCSDFLFARLSAARTFLISTNSVLLIWRSSTSRHERSDWASFLPASVESLPLQNRRLSKRKPIALESFHEPLDRRNGRFLIIPRQIMKDGGFPQQNGLQQALESSSPNVRKISNLNPFAESLEPWDGNGFAWAARRLARPLERRSESETSSKWMCCMPYSPSLGAGGRLLCVKYSLWQSVANVWLGRSQMSESIIL